MNKALTTYHSSVIIALMKKNSQQRSGHDELSRVPMSPLYASVGESNSDRTQALSAVQKSLLEHGQDAAYIYALTDPRTGRIRYIGRTVNLTQRKQNHFSNIHSRSLQAWYKRLAPRRPILTVLEVCPRAEMIAREYVWIHRYRRHRLLNHVYRVARQRPRYKAKHQAHLFS